MAWVEGLTSASPFSFPFFFFLNKVYLFLAVLDLHCCWGFSQVAPSRGYSLVAEHGLLIAVVSLVVTLSLEHRLSSVAHELGRSSACGIFPDQGSYQYPLHQQEDSLPLNHQGSFYSSTTNNVKMALANNLPLGNLRKNKPKYPHLQILANICWCCFCSKHHSEHFIYMVTQST